MAAEKDNLIAAVSSETPEMAMMKERVRASWRENRKIEDGAYDESCAVRCVNGTFVGRHEDGFTVFKGIPFVGAQPTGDLRWKAPVDYALDDGVYEALYNAKTALQSESAGDENSLFFKGEDCLYLNLWTSEIDPGAKKPVMVWIHGGGFMMGGTVDPSYQCDVLVRENPDVVFVTIPYRLGIFGFMHLEHLADGAGYTDAPNLGLMDQMQALKWVHENIAGFGGDPDNVTIFGESAGGGSVSLLPLVKGSHTYIRRIIAQSGSPALCRPKKKAIEATAQVMEAVGAKTVADLMACDVQDLINASLVLGMRNIGPEMDGTYLPLDPYGAYADGAVADIDIIQGCNKDELGYFVSILGGPASYNAWAAGRKARKLAQLTDGEKGLVEDFCASVQGEDFEHTSRLFDQIVFIAPLFRTAELQAAAGGTSFVYYFTPESSDPLMRCGHGVEVPTVFGKPEVGRDLGLDFEETFSRTLRDMWVQFARCGDPSLSAEASPDGHERVWPAYDPKDRYVMCFDEDDVHVERESERGIVSWDKCYFLTKYYVI